MKSFFSKITSLFLAVLILFSAISFTVSMHFCCDELIDVAIWGKAKDCTKKLEKEEKSIGECTKLQEKECCSNQSFVKSGGDTIKKTYSELTSENSLFLATFFYTYKELFEDVDKSTIVFKHYKSPLLLKDIQVLHQTFLI